jgi:hypothetical protein
MTRRTTSTERSKMDRKSALAETTFDCLDRRGKATPLRVAIETLEHVPRDGRLAEYGGCRISIDPLIGTLEVGGLNEFQALCLAIDVVRRTLKALVREEWTIVVQGSTQPIDLDHPQFFPLLTAEDWRKSARSRKGGTQ